MRIALRVTAAVAVAACAVTAAQLAVVPAAEASAGRPAGVVAAGGELVNGTTGKWLWSRGLNAERPIASLTKVMTALVVLSAGDLNRRIRVSEAAVRYGEPYSAGSAGLHVGDVLTSWQLLEGLLLPSGADAAYLLARSYGPGWHAFVRSMNATAASLGMTRTHFANFDGLPWPTENATYSTPHDLMILAAAAMRSADFGRIVRQRSHYIAATSKHHKYYWKNTDLLLTSYRGAIGIKTGFTLAAGYCLLFAAQRSGRELIGVVLDSTSTGPATRFRAAAALLRWGFAR